MLILRGFRRLQRQPDDKQLSLETQHNTESRYLVKWKKQTVFLKKLGFLWALLVFSALKIPTVITATINSSVITIIHVIVAFWWEGYASTFGGVPNHACPLSKMNFSIIWLDLFPDNCANYSTASHSNWAETFQLIIVTHGEALHQIQLMVS